jgi:hypothetical protein
MIPVRLGLVLLVGAAIVACQGETDPVPAETNPLVGTWERLFLENRWEKMALRADGSYESTGAVQPSSSGSVAETIETGKWSLSGDKLTFDMAMSRFTVKKNGQVTREIEQKPGVYTMVVEWLGSDTITLDDDQGSPFAFKRAEQR